MESCGRGRRCQSPPGPLTHLHCMIRGPFVLFRHRKKSSVTDSFSNLVHRPTMDQFTEGAAPQDVLSALLAPGSPGPGPGRDGKGKLSSSSSSPRGLSPGLDAGTRGSNLGPFEEWLSHEGGDSLT